MKKVCPKEENMVSRKPVVSQWPLLRTNWSIVWP